MPETLKNITDKREQSLLRSLRDTLSTAELSLWEAGDILNTLKEKYGYTTKRIIALLDLKRWKRNRLDEIAKTARAFPESRRQDALTFSDHLVARKSAVTTAKTIKEQFGKTEAPDYALALNNLKKLPGSGKHQGRELTKNMIADKRVQKEPERLAQVEKLSAENRSLIGSMFQGNNVDLLKKIAKRSVAVVHLDPPYANYSKTADGTLFPHSTSQVSCDNNDSRHAIDATIAALKASVELPKKNGVILLWQNSRRIPTQISAAIDDMGLIDHPFLIWDKERSVLGNPASGVMFSIETCYVLTRKGEFPLGMDSVGREQVIRGEDRGNGARLNHRSANYEPHHQMEKPSWVNDDLLRRFTATGDIVVDAFGCSASMCIAAQGMGRRWMYSESNAMNFALGKRNMENHMLAAAKKSA